MPRAFGFATAPPSSVVAGQTYSVSVNVTNQSTYGGSPVGYPFYVRFVLKLVTPSTVNTSTQDKNVYLAGGASGVVSYNFTVPVNQGYTSGYILASLLTTDKLTVLSPVIRGDFTISEELVIPSGSVAW